MHSVPFSISDAYEGLADVDGLVRFDADVLTLEFQTKDAFFGLIKSNVQNVQLSLTDLASVHFAKKMLRATLTLRCITDSVTNSPGHSDSRSSSFETTS